jgi:alginate O-acetyltransferase complex protein AlgJ
MTAAVLLSRYRRFWALLAALLLAAPLLFTAPTKANLSADELRALATPPPFPHNLTDALDMPPKIDAWLQDHFGLRSTLIHAYALLTQAVLRSGNISVFIGRKGAMFYRGDDAIRQSAGLIRRDKQVTETVNFLVAMKDILASKGIPLVVASPPNAATIYGDYLPSWARNAGQATEQDLFVNELAARGVTTADLRPVLRAARESGKVYRLHDTHWTARGAVAAFNAIAKVASHPDWQINVASALGPTTIVTGGDLARMVGINGDVTEPDQLLAFPAARRETLGSGLDQIYSLTLDQPGPTILIIGDSFAHLLASVLAQHAGRVVWMHHQWCGFDWKGVEELKPDEVWWLPTERYMLCGAKPRNFPTPHISTAF